MQPEDQLVPEGAAELFKWFGQPSGGEDAMTKLLRGCTATAASVDQILLKTKPANPEDEQAAGGASSRCSRGEIREVLADEVD